MATFRNTADGILWAVDKGGPIQPETLEHLCAWPTSFPSPCRAFR